MAILSIQLGLCEGEFVTGSIIIDDTLNEISVGGVYNLSGCTIIKGGIEFCFNNCFTVTGSKLTISVPNTIILNSYGIEGCTDCRIDTSNYLVFGECSERGLLGRIVVPISGFTGTTVIDDVYLLSMYVNYEGNQIQYTACFQLIGYAINKSDRDYDVFLLEQTQKTDCKTCINESPIIYEVADCLNGTPYYVSFPSTGFDGHLITFTDLAGLTQYCGIVYGTIEGQPTTGILISDLGIPEETGVTCDDCLLNVAEKRKLVNCLNPLDIEIVWASALFEPEQSTHLSSGDGCYQISPDVIPSGATITISELANFDPQNDCNTCFECYGLVYDYQSCEQLEIFVPSNVIDTSSNSLYCNKGIVIDSSNIAYVVNDCSLYIAKIDLSTQTILETQYLNYSPRHLAINETDGVICVANGTNIVTFVNLSDLSQFQSSTINGFLNNPSSVYFDPIDSFFYITYNNCCGVVQTIEVWSGSAYNSMSYVTSFGSTDGYIGIVRVGSQLYMSRSTNILEIYDIVSLGVYTFNSSYFLPFTPRSIDYDNINSIYLCLDNQYIIWNVSTSGFTFFSYPTTCGGGGTQTIKVNNSADRIYIADYSCNYIYEIQKSTNSFLRNYNLSNYSYSNFYQPFGIANDNLGNTWFASYDDVFTLSSTTDFVTGQTIGNEFLSAGTTFFNYQLSACCEITSVANNTDDSFTFNEYLSMLHYEDCQTCTGTTHELFYCQSCDGGIEAVLVAPSGSFSIGQFVRSHWGNSHFLCFEIIDNYTVANYGTGYPSFEAQGEPPFASCSACTSGTSIGLTIINCDTLVPSQVNVTLENWLQIAGFPTFVQNPVISDSNGVCYQVVNLCPIDNNNPEFPIQEFFVNQLFCRLSNATPGRPAPVSAGTEYFACQICCPCESGGTVTSVAVPHPVWTGLYGNAVTLLDAVQLGGMNGLNN